MTDLLFHIVEGAQAILIHGGVYKQVPVYVRADLIYAKFNGGYVRLAGDGTTSKPDMRCEALDLTDPMRLGVDKLGRLATGAAIVKEQFAIPCDAPKALPSA